MDFTSQKQCALVVFTCTPVASWLGGCSVITRSPIKMTKANVEIEVTDATYDGMLELFASLIAEDEFILSRYEHFDILITCSRSDNRPDISVKG
jgi:hypothetical protein